MEIDYEKQGMEINKTRSRRYFDAGLLEQIDESYLGEVQEYWVKFYNKKIDPSIHIAFMNLIGKKDPRIIPGDIMWNELIPYFNDQKMITGYRDKNIYDILIDVPNSVETVIKRVRGNYYDSRNLPVNKSTIVDILLETDTEFIIKPSDSNNGVGIEKMTIDGDGKVLLSNKQVSLEEIEKEYSANFAIQKIIKQHQIMSTPHPQSVNTLRMVTFRWKGEIKYLLTFARFGAAGSVKDNAGAGGVCLGVKENGEFLDIAIDENCNAHTHHPTTNYEFSQMPKIPNFSEFKQFVISGHKGVLHHDFISWDIAVGEDAKPVFIEANFAGATWLYQMACQQPLFGNLTEEVLSFVQNEMENKVKRDIQVRSQKSKERKLKKRNKRLRKNNKVLQEKLENAEMEIQQLNKKINMKK